MKLDLAAAAAARARLSPGTRRLALFFSGVLHPLLVPLWLVAWLLYGPVAVPATRPGQLLLAVAALTLGVPALGTLLLLRLGYVDSVELGERRQRHGPLLLAAASFGAAALVVARLAGPASLVCQLLQGITVAVLLTTLITFWWKISAHGVGMGGALALLLGCWQLQPGLAVGLTLALGGGLVVGVSWARLVLRAHTPAQVAAGLALGLGTGLCYIIP